MREAFWNQRRVSDIRTEGSLAVGWVGGCTLANTRYTMHNFISKLAAENRVGDF